MVRVVEVIGIKEAMRALRRLPDIVRRNNISGAAAKSLLPVKARAKSILNSQEKGTGEGGRSKVNFIKRSVKVSRFNSNKNPGAKVHIKGPQLAVGDRFWPVEHYAVLHAFGSKERFIRRTTIRRGKVKGHGNFVKNAGRFLERRVDGKFSKEMVRMLDKSIIKASRGA